VLTEDHHYRARFGMWLLDKDFKQFGGQEFGGRSVAFPRLARQLTEPSLSVVRS
jgi:hypothetical protein